MELVTAVLSGSRNLELRVFSENELDITTEQSLTRRICRLVDSYEVDWRRWLIDTNIYPFIICLESDTQWYKEFSKLLNLKSLT